MIRTGRDTHPFNKTNHRRFFAAAACCLLFCLTLHAQLPDYHLQLFGYAEGIRAGNILGLTKDNKGFVWILSPRVVQRYDGRQVKNFKAEGDLRHIFCDSKGRVWISSIEKVFRFFDDFRGFQEVEVVKVDSLAYDGPIFEMPDQSVWVLTSSGFCKYDETQQRFLPGLQDLPLPQPYNINSFTRYGQTLFFRKKTTYYAYNTERKTLKSLPDRALYKAFALDENTVLASTWNNNSLWYDFERDTIFQADLPLHFQNKANPALRVFDIARFAPDRYLLVSWQGLFEFRRSTGTFKKLNLFLNGRPITTNDFANLLLLETDNGEGRVAWLATQDGIARFVVNRQQLGLIRLQPPEQAWESSVNYVRRFAEDDRGNLWVATGNGLACLNKEQHRWLFFPPVAGAADRLAHPSVRGLTFDGKYLVIGPTSLGLWLLDPHTMRYRRPVYPPGEEGRKVQQLSEGDFVDEINTLNNGDHLVFGRDAMYLLDGKTYLLTQLDIPPAKENANFAAQGPDGIVWIGTYKGLHCLDAQLNYLQPAPLAKMPTCLFMCDSGVLLVASEDGLFEARHRNGQAEVRKLTNAFDNIQLNTVIQDKNGIIWTTGELGIHRYDPASGRIDLLDYADQVQGYGFNANAWFRSSNGAVFFGGNNGINYLNPETFGLPDSLSAVFIQHIRIDGNDTLFYYLPERPELKYFQKSIEVEFAAPFFNNPDKIQYRYRLEGYDDDWKSIGNTPSLRLTSLPSGAYTLRVQASLNSMDWTEARNPFAFSIAAPYWKKGWFVALLLALVGAGGYGFVQNRNRKLQQKQEELEAEQVINYFATSMYERATVEEILWDVARNCIGRLQFEDCVIYLFDEQRDMLVQKAAYGPKSPEQFEIVAPLEIPAGQGIVGSVAATGKSEWIRDTRTDSRYIVDDRRRLSEIAVPILSNSQVLGVIDCEHSARNFFTERHLSVLTTIASLCANKITRAKAEQEKEAAKKVLDDTQQKMREVEMQALRAQMNPHFIFNCLNSINRYIVKSDQATASLYLTRFAKLIRLILDNSNSKNVVLSNELEALRLYIEMESLRFAQKFHWCIEMDESVNPDSIEVPPLIIQPFVENAIWHGLLHKAEAGYLCVSLRMIGDNMLECTVEDDGVGREKAKALKSKSATTRKSLGMQLSEDRLALLNQHAQLNSSIEIIDLKTEDGRAAGTKVVVRIPV